MKLFKHIDEEIYKGKRVVIAIDGPSASGKSTLSKNLMERYDALVFHVDDYFLPESKQTEERLEEIGGFFDYERMISEIFLNINQEYVISNHYNCNTKELEIREPFVNREVVVIEGVYSHSPHLQKYITYKVFMDVDQEEQIRRIKKRNGEKMLKRWVSEWIPKENEYFSHYKVKSNADFIVNI